MNRFLAILIILASLSLSAGAASAAPSEAGEGYAPPTYPELVQTLIMMGGADINNKRFADEYGRIVYCDLYRKNFSNDVLWEKIRDEIVSRVLKKKEYFRIKYEVVGVFYLGRYDFNNQYFPISPKSPLTNVGTVNLISYKDNSTDCAGQGVFSPVFPMVINMKLNEPLTIQGFKIHNSNVEKLMVRMEEAGNTDRRIYGRIRMVTTDAKSLAFNSSEATLNGKVIAVDFFLDHDLTKQVAHIQVNKE